VRKTIWFIFSSQENKRRIKHVSKTLNPEWDHTVIYGHMHREELQYKKLEITVWDYDRFKANDFLGQVTIDLKGNIKKKKRKFNSFF
jgi:Ca2+-dependent lipid-binding protein